MEATGVGLGQLLLALDATMVTLVEAPRGLDLPVSSAALIDHDDVRLGLADAAGSADVFLLLGIDEHGVLTWLDQQVDLRAPAAIFVKEPSDAVVNRARQRVPPSWPSNPAPGGSGSTAWSTTSSNTTGIARIRLTTPAPTCSDWRSRSPTAPTAW